ncbi:hypothetical protein TrispH2_007039, partial [Trichoplax sp. H2]
YTISLDIHSKFRIEMINIELKNSS